MRYSAKSMSPQHSCNQYIIHHASYYCYPKSAQATKINRSVLNNNSTILNKSPIPFQNSKFITVAMQLQINCQFNCMENSAILDSPAFYFFCLSAKIDSQVGILGPSFFIHLTNDQVSIKPRFSHSGFIFTKCEFC